MYFLLWQYQDSSESKICRVQILPRGADINLNQSKRKDQMYGQGPMDEFHKAS